MDLYLVSDKLGNIFYFNNSILREFESANYFPPIDNFNIIEEYFKLDSKETNRYIFNFSTKKLTMMKKPDENYEDSKIVFELCNDIHIEDIYPEYCNLPSINPFSFKHNFTSTSAWEINKFNDIADTLDKYNRKLIKNEIMRIIPERLHDLLLYIELEYKEYINPIITKNTIDPELIPLIYASRHFINQSEMNNKILHIISTLWNNGYLIQVEHRHFIEYLVVYHMPEDSFKPVELYKVKIK